MLEERGKEDFTEEFQAHPKRKEEASSVKTTDKAHCSTDNNFMSATFDMQSVLQIPSSPALPLYYSRKLCVSNLGVYNLTTPNDASCYCSSEVEGRHGSNQIKTCISDWYCWIRQLPSMVFEVSLFSDTCGGRNCNQNVAAMFLYAVQRTPFKGNAQLFTEWSLSHGV